LAEFVLRGLMEHGCLHADPNLANFAFLEDGRVVVYDFGCVKQVPVALARGYAELLVAAAEGRHGEVPEILKGMGVTMDGERPFPSSVLDPYLEMFGEALREHPPYTFGEGGDALYRRLFDLGLSNLHRMPEMRDMRFPQDAIFIDRALGGHFGNLSRLGATGPWRELVFRYAERVPADGSDG
jgi:hypothetical protein